VIDPIGQGYSILRPPRLFYPSLSRSTDSSQVYSVEEQAESPDQSGHVTSGGGLNEVDEVATGVFKEDGDDGTHARWFTAKADTQLLETAVLGGDVVG
jgi:hypothetical protein